MSVDIGEALSQGFSRTVSRNGLVLFGITFVLAVLSGVFSASVVPSDVGSGPGPGMGAGGAASVSLPIPSAVAGILALVVTVLTFVVGIAALRTFVTDRTDQLPEDAFTRNIGWATVNFIVGFIVFAIVVAIGFVLLVIPGIFLLVTLYFWSVFVAVEDENFVEGFSSSWELTKGNRLTLFLLGLLVVVITTVVNVIFGIPQIFLPDVLGLVISQLGSSFVSIFIAATTARAYVQLTAEDEDAEAVA